MRMALSGLRALPPATRPLFSIARLTLHASRFSFACAVDTRVRIGYVLFEIAEGEASSGRPDGR
jgi:hypothetical protein